MGVLGCFLYLLYCLVIPHVKNQIAESYDWMGRGSQRLDSRWTLQTLAGVPLLGLMTLMLCPRRA